jgi:hypothetical protein
MAVADRRKAARSTVLDTALIRFADVSVCCAVRDLSEGGAALDLGMQTAFPINSP